MSLLATLIADLPGAAARPTLAPRADFATPEPHRKRYHRPSPEHMRHAIAAHRAQVAADLARIDQAVLDACRRGPLSAIALAQKLKITQKRARSAMRRLQAAGKAREVRLPCEGRADVVGVEVCNA